MTDADSQDPPAESQDPPVDPPAPGDDKPLGPEGERALDAWKQRAKDAEAKAKKVDTLEAELADLKRKGMTPDEAAIDAAKEAGRTEAKTEVLRERFTDKLAALTAGKIVDPDLFADADVAMRLLNLTEIPVTSTGAIDSAAITEKITGLLTEKPYLAGATPPPLPPDLGQGARGSKSTVEMDPKKLAERVPPTW